VMRRWAVSLLAPRQSGIAQDVAASNHRSAASLTTSNKLRIVIITHVPPRKRGNKWVAGEARRGWIFPAGQIRATDGGKAKHVGKPTSPEKKQRTRCRAETVSCTRISQFPQSKSHSRTSHFKRSPESVIKTPAAETALTAISASLIHSLAMESDTLMNFKPVRGARWIFRCWSTPSHRVQKISLASLSSIFK